jgi:hypothetical protein
MRNPFSRTSRRFAVKKAYDQVGSAIFDAYVKQGKSFSDIAIEIGQSELTVRKWFSSPSKFGLRQLSAFCTAIEVRISFDLVKNP